MFAVKIVLLCGLAFAKAFPAVEDPVIAKWVNDGPRYSYIEDDEGNAHLVDHWVKMSDIKNMARYNADTDNVYHLFTRANPTVSQPLVMNDAQRVLASNFDGRKRTVVVMHGFAGSATSAINTVLVPSYLTADDCNVLVLDWSAGSYFGLNAIRAGQAAARFIDWVNGLTGSNAGLYTITGYSVGGHGAGIIARNVNGFVSYVIGLDPADRWDSFTKFRPTDGLYTEVIHTSTMGEQEALAHVDFYPNGGSDMPGCLTAVCDHYRYKPPFQIPFFLPWDHPKYNGTTSEISFPTKYNHQNRFMRKDMVTSYTVMMPWSYFYLGESVVTGGFTGRRCASVSDAHAGTCDLEGTLNMGGLQPKYGQTGIYYLTTNGFPPFSQG